VKLSKRYVEVFLADVFTFFNIIVSPTFLFEVDDTTAEGEGASVFGFG